MVANLASKDELKRVYEYTKEKGYFVNNLVNSAGFGDRTDFKEMNIEKQMAMTDVDCNALLYFTRVFLDQLQVLCLGHICAHTMLVKALY